jgi:hypothetical protein
MPESSASPQRLTNFSPALWLEVYDVSRGGLLQDISPEGRVSAVATR